MKPKYRIKSLWKSFFCILLITFHISFGFCRPPNSNVESQGDSKNFDDSSSSSLRDILRSETEVGSPLDLKAKDIYKDNTVHSIPQSSINGKNNQKRDMLVKQSKMGNNFTSSIRTDRDNEDFENDLSEFLLGNNDIVTTDVEYALVGGSSLIDEGSVLSVDVLFFDDYEASQSDVSQDVIDGLEEGDEEDDSVVQLADESHRRPQTSSVMDGSEVASFIDEDSRKQGNRNLSRKRRQRSSPDTEKSVPPHGRRRRKRKRRHRLLLKARDSNRNNHLDSQDGFSDHKGRRDRFLLRSDSPGYVITSASEVKKDWCRTVPLRQKVSEPNCRSKVIKNNFCYGQCNSFFIPHTGRTGNKVAFQSCAFCKPHRPKWGNVTLNCPGRNPPKVEKTILVVESCRCITEVLQ